MDPLVHKTTLWFRCLACHRFYLTKNEFISHRTESECRFKYRKIHRERSKRNHILAEVNGSQVQVTAGPDNSKSAIPLSPNPEIPQKITQNIIQSGPATQETKQPAQESDLCISNTDDKTPEETSKIASKYPVASGGVKIPCYFCPRGSRFDTLVHLEFHINKHHTQEDIKHYPIIQQLTLPKPNQIRQIPQIDQSGPQIQEIVQPSKVPCNNAVSNANVNSGTESSRALPKGALQVTPKYIITSGGVKISCYFCPRRAGFDTLAQLEIHMSRHHTQEDAKHDNNPVTHRHHDQDSLSKRRTFPVLSKRSEFKCQVCSKRCPTLPALLQHICRVHKGRRFPCQICPKTFPVAQNLERHISTVHEGRRDHACAICAKTFTQRVHLKLHVRSVHEGQRHNCPTCSKAFTQIWRLKGHISAVHEGRRDHACAICAKTFSRKDYLHLHIRAVHKGQRPYKCPACPAAFTQSSSLKYHISGVHEGRRDHACAVCSKRFSQLGSLKVHVSTVHEDRRPHACTFCSKGFGTSSDLRKHLKAIVPCTERKTRIVLK